MANKITPTKKKIVSRKTFSISNVILIVFCSISAIFTAVVFMNSYELFFSKNITAFEGMGINSISELKSSGLIKSVINSTPTNTIYDNEEIGDFGKPIELKIPKLSNRYPVIPHITDQNNLLYRAGNGHFLIYSKSKDGFAGNMIVYINKDWRTIQQSDRINIEDNLFLDTDKDWRYMYKIISKKNVPFGESYVASETNRQNIVLIVESENEKYSEVFQAELAILQSTGR